MKPRFRFRTQRFAPVALLPASLALCATLAGTPGDQPATDPVARIEGDDITIRGQMNLERETGHTFAELASGSEVTVRSRQARIQLAGGGEIGVCGPAKFSLLGSGATLTLALDFGRIHARLNQAQSLTIYTPLDVATPLPISSGADELHLGLEQTGQMCLYAVRGAVRVQPQFGEGPVVVPQSVEASFSEGHLDAVSATPGTCRCNALEAFVVSPALSVRSETTARAEEADHASPNTEMKLNSTASPAPRAAQPAIESPAPEEPVWKVIMPPLRFNAAASLAAPPMPETILLLREVRVQSGTVFHGSVQAQVAPARPVVTIASQETTAANPSASVEQKSTFGTRVRNFFRRLFGSKTKK